MMVSVFTAARYIMGVANKQTMGAMALQKLLYLSQGYSLAWTGDPIFYNDIEAGPNGPLIPDLAKEHEGQTMVNLGKLPRIHNENLSFHQKQILDEIVRAYGSLTGWQLRTLTMKHEPWFESYSDEIHDRNISTNSMLNYFNRIDR